LWVVKENGRAARDAHLIDDKAVAKMGHPGLCACEKQMPCGDDNKKSRSNSWDRG
jgi:hypothetical protein